MEPPLPVDEETSVTFSCPRKHVNVGSNTATCQGGLLEPAQPPRCLKTGNLEKKYFHLIELILEILAV